MWPACRTRDRMGFGYEASGNVLQAAADGDPNSDRITPKVGGNDCGARASSAAPSSAIRRSMNDRSNSVSSVFRIRQYLAMLLRCVRMRARTSSVMSSPDGSMSLPL